MILGKYMTLREYLFINRLTVTKFSELINYSRTHLSAVLHGSLKPGKKLARVIEKATEGKVTIEELMKSKEK